MPTIAPYGSWRSPVTAAVAASGAVRLNGLALDPADQGDVYWLEGRATEGGRNVIVRRRGQRVEDVTPPSYNVRSRVHEYGGGAFTVADGVVYFVQDSDQRVWRQDPGQEPFPISPEGAFRHADLVVDRRRGRLMCVREAHRDRGEPENTIVSFPLAGGPIQVLARGADFYSDPRLDPSGDRLTYLSWDHPRMPWQGTELWLTTLDEAGAPAKAQRIAGSASESVLSPRFSPDGQLVFVTDRRGWWNLHDQRGPLCTIEAEMGAAPWVFGLGTYGWIAPEVIACTYQKDGFWRLGLLKGGVLTPVRSPLTEISHFHTVSGRAVFLGASPSEPPAIWELLADGTVAPVHRPNAITMAPSRVSAPQAVSYPSGGAVAHALFYPPHNPDFQGAPGERPPLIVISHGGPTAAASSSLSLMFQFWTSRGFALLDVNYRGSTGYGRAYRDSLEGAWGIADVEDCASGARYLVERGLADPARLAIRGGSAGGYTTLAALAFTDVFRAGASYYGVSDLTALARDTHKFESRYLDSLVGPYPARADLYRERSPINHIDRLSCPVIFFQGLEDKVVPPNQAERMVTALTAKGISAPYLAFPGEQHGFRRAETVIRSLESELTFYRKVFALPEPR
jgi:dipeptidyl aminopeptidase/acylaminoacyl peptidase